MGEDSFHITVDDIDNSDYVTILTNPHFFSVYEMESFFGSLLKKYEVSGDMSSWRLCYFLKAIFSFRFSHSGNVIGFEPKALIYSRQAGRSSDYDIEFKDVLSHIRSKTKNSFVISRVCDIIWMNNRIDVCAGKQSVLAYSEIIDRACDELNTAPSLVESDIFNVIDSLERGLAIASMLVGGRRKGLDNPILGRAKKIYNVLFELKIFNGFSRLSSILYKYRAIDAFILASNAESMADFYYDKVFFEAVKELLLFSGELYLRNNLKEKQKICLIKIAELTLCQYKKADTAMLKAHWLRCALDEYRAVGGMKNEIASIKAKLEMERELVLDEMVTFSSPLDLSEIADEVEKVYLDLSLSEKFKKMISRFSVPDLPYLKERAKSDASDFAMLSMFSTDVLDEKGRLIAQRKPINSSEDISYEQACENYLRNSQSEHQVYVGGEFEVVRMGILNDYLLTENTFDPITFQSPFVPPRHGDIFSLGFYKLWQGDYLSACYLLIPQLENSIRWVLECSKNETTKIDPQLFEEAISLSQMLSNQRGNMEGVFGPDIVMTMDLLFNFKGGPSFRHDLAHGRLSVNHCYSASAVFACCFIFYVTCRPLFKYWDDVVAPHLDAKG